MSSIIIESWFTLDCAKMGPKNHGHRGGPKGHRGEALASLKANWSARESGVGEGTEVEGLKVGMGDDNGCSGCP